MGPFFYLKKDIPLIPKQFNKLTLFIFFFEIPPSATILFFVNPLRKLNL